jgi:ring-1,2-phenylacetyl-CoA epoxidase subunit PaaD
MVTPTTAIDAAQAREIAAGVVDPEIPVVSIAELGILRDVRVEGNRVVVTITPTYSGCPAMRQIEDDLRSALRSAGFEEIEVAMVHSPAWTTDWITSEGIRKLATFGIAPPTPIEDVLCPRCDSTSPRIVALFGSTACKALMVCCSCGEPFDYFKEF